MRILRRARSAAAAEEDADDAGRRRLAHGDPDDFSAVRECLADEAGCPADEPECQGRTPSGPGVPGHDAECPHAQRLMQTRWQLADARRENAELWVRLWGLLLQIRALSESSSAETRWRGARLRLEASNRDPGAPQSDGSDVPWANRSWPRALRH